MIQPAPTIRVPVATPSPPPIEEGLQFWHPNRFGVRFAPESFRKKLKGIHDDLDVTWHPSAERWIVWYRRPRITHHLCPGWMLLFVVEDSEQRYVPLDDRTLAAVYEQSGFKWGSGKKYWARIEEQAQRDHDARDKTRDDLIDDIGSAQWDHTKIQVSMCGPSSGSKFSKHHAGD
tara:strand:+ start:260 stop:784 length:525 start_codon:yes stop_codon:yes gene_type:complete